MKVFILILVLILISGCYSSINQVCFEEKCFNVEISDNDIERSVGLMYRTSLSENNGMLFIFESQGIYSFWMKNTKIPLDIIWINKDLEVVDIKKNVQPCASERCESYSSTFDSLYVLEINSGLTEKYDINIGDKVKIK